MKEENKTFYVVSIITGEFDDAWPRNLFITDFEYKASFYCSIAKSKFSAYKEYYEQKVNEHYLIDGDECNYVHYAERLSLAKAHFNYHPIKKRDSIKID